MAETARPESQRGGQPRAQTTAARLASLEATVDAQAEELAAIRKASVATEAQAKETHDAVARMEAALFRAQPGHDKALIDRFAAATIKIEGAGTTLHILFWLAGGLALVGAALAFLRPGT